MARTETAQKVVHVTISGTMLGGSEIWQTGFYVGSPTQHATAPTQAYTSAVAAAWETFWKAPLHGISSAYKFDAVKAVLLQVNGDYDAAEPVQSFPAAAVSGGGGASQLPPQVSLVATTIGGSGKGLGGKGRMYLPGVNFPIDATGHITNVASQAVATGLAAFFDTINGSMDAPGEVINASRGHVKLLGAGARNVPVNGVRVGNVYDTQRRRRNALTEVYSSAVVAD